jgi:hypothetical protein
MKNNGLSGVTMVVLLLFCGVAFAQQRKPLDGRVLAGDAYVVGLFVINKHTGAETKTDGNGNFTIAARPGDRLTIYSPQIEVRDFVVSAASFNEHPYKVEVEPKATELNEVVIVEMNPEKMGLVPKGQKQLTVAERRLKTASEFKPNFMFMLMGGISMPLDSIINAISGRTKMLKKNLATEHKEFALDKISSIYTEQQIISQLKIPAELVQGFVYYAVEDPDCAEALRLKNDALVKMRLMDLARTYLALQKEANLPVQQSTPATANEH